MIAFLKKTLLLLLGVTIYSCTDEVGDSTTIENTVVISVIDNKGVDLLNPNTPDSYKKEEIRVYYLIDNEILEVFRSNDPNSPRNFNIFNNPVFGKYTIQLYANIDSSEDITTTYLEWNETDIDTIECEVKRYENSSIQIMKAWFNGELKADITQQDIMFTIIK